MKRKLFHTAALLLSGALLLTGCGTQTPPANYIPAETNYISASQLTGITSADLTILPDNPNGSLKVPTYITKVHDTYFIVDCYNNQVIYNDNLTDPIYTWRIMTNDVTMPHTLASDGSVYLIDDTENNRILVMEEGVNENGFQCFVPTQEFTDIGVRPHYIVYHEPTDTFYAWSSQSGEMYLFRRNREDNRVYLTQKLYMPPVANSYVRSFTIIDDRIFFVSGNASIIEAELDTFRVRQVYPIPDELYGMVQITKIDDYFYITNSTDINGNQDYATIIRTKDLEDLYTGEYEDVYHHFIGGGTPYYISNIGDKWYLTEHRIPGHGIFEFKVTDNEITDVKTIY